MMTSTTSFFLQQCLDRLAADDRDARTQLLEYIEGRLTILAERMFARYPALQRRAESEDLLQDALLRLWKSLSVVKPATVSDLMALSAVQIRRCLIELIRKHFGRHRHTSRSATQMLSLKSSQFDNLLSNRAQEDCPVNLAVWSEFHLAIDTLPEPDKTVFDLIYYHDLPQPEVAKLLGVSERQLARYWAVARCNLFKLLQRFWLDPE